MISLDDQDALTISQLSLTQAGGAEVLGSKSRHASVTSPRRARSAAEHGGAVTLDIPYEKLLQSVRHAASAGSLEAPGYLLQNPEGKGRYTPMSDGDSACTYRANATAVASNCP